MVDEIRVAGWTAEEISKRLGISSAVFKGSMFGASEITKLRNSGFTHIELSLMNGPDQTFDYQDQKQASEIMSECGKQGIQVLSFHLPQHPSLLLHSEDDKERNAAVREVLAMAETLLTMGGHILVEHLLPCAHTKKSLEELLVYLQDFPVILAAENVGKTSIRDILSLIDEFNSDQLKMVLDIGHEIDSRGINPFTKIDKARESVTQCRERLCHVHLHDSLPVEKKPDHRPPLHPNGIIQWNEVFKGLKDVGYEGVFLFEDGRGEETEEWIRMAGSFPQHFIERYGS